MKLSVRDCISIGRDIKSGKWEQNDWIPRRFKKGDYTVYISTASLLYVSLEYKRANIALPFIGKIIIWWYSRKLRKAGELEETKRTKAYKKDKLKNIRQDLGI